jgi:hypothetical protein
MGSDKPLTVRVKVLLGIVFGSFVFIGCIAVTASILLFDKVYPFDEKHQNEIAQTIVKIDKLPSGFDRIMAAHFNDVFIVEFRSIPPDLDIKLSRSPGHQTTASPRELLTESMKITDPSTIKEKAVGNSEMAYSLRESKMTTSSNLEGFVVDKKSKEVIHIESSYAGRPFKMENFDKFIQCINGF